MKIQIEVDSTTLKRLVMAHLASTLGDVSFSEDDVTIKVLSRQNYRNTEWEAGDFKAVISVVRP